jgi:hypothetical protein
MTKRLKLLSAQATKLSPPKTEAGTVRLAEAVAATKAVGLVSGAYLGFSFLCSRGVQLVPFRACPFYWLTGADCPLCGLTTAFSHILQGDFAGSIGAHLLGLPIFGLVVLCAVAAAGIHLMELARSCPSYAVTKKGSSDQRPELP